VRTLVLTSRVGALRRAEVFGKGMMHARVYNSMKRSPQVFGCLGFVRLNTACGRARVLSSAQGSAHSLTTHRAGSTAATLLLHGCNRHGENDPVLGEAVHDGRPIERLPRRAIPPHAARLSIMFRLGCIRLGRYTRSDTDLAAATACIGSSSAPQ
jgi:hypothetical protein